jgi:dihydroneopterin aldolase
MPCEVPHRRGRAPEGPRRRDLIVIGGFQLPPLRARGGRRRRLDVRLWLDLWEAARRNRIERTVDYRRVHRLLRGAVDRGGRGVAARLAEAILRGFPRVDEVEVRMERGGAVRLRRPPARRGRRK